MDEMKITQSIRDAYHEPRAPEPLVRSVILRAEAVTMGRQARQSLPTAQPEQQPELAARALVGQLAEVSALPEGSEPQLLAQQLSREKAFTRLLAGGDLPRRLESGELLRQLVGGQAQAAPEQPRKNAPENQGPSL